MIPDFEGGGELKESSEVKGSLGPTGFRSAQGPSNWRGRCIERTFMESIVRPHPQEGDWSGRDKRAKLVEIQRRRDVSLKE